jgi:hypothetical protein
MDRTPITFEDIERRFSEDSRKSYYSWIRQVVTLSVGALTLFVAFRNSYISQNVKCLLLLKFTWGLLAVSILSGMYVLWGEVETPLDAINHLREMRKSYGDYQAAKNVNTNIPFIPKKRYKLALKILSISFVASFLLISIFAIINN